MSEAAYQVFTALFHVLVPYIRESNLKLNREIDDTCIEIIEQNGESLDIGRKEQLYRYLKHSYEHFQFDELKVIIIISFCKLYNPVDEQKYNLDKLLTKDIIYLCDDLDTLKYIKENEKILHPQELLYEYDWLVSDLISYGYRYIDYIFKHNFEEQCKYWDGGDVMDPTRGESPILYRNYNGGRQKYTDKSMCDIKWSFTDKDRDFYDYFRIPMPKYFEDYTDVWELSIVIRLITIELELITVDNYDENKVMEQERIILWLCENYKYSEFARKTITKILKYRYYNRVEFSDNEYEKDIQENVYKSVFGIYGCVAPLDDYYSYEDYYGKRLEKGSKFILRGEYYYTNLLGIISRKSSYFKRDEIEIFEKSRFGFEDY